MNEKAVKPHSCATIADLDKHTSSSLSGDSVLVIGVGENRQFSRSTFAFLVFKSAIGDVVIYQDSN